MSKQNNYSLWCFLNHSFLVFLNQELCRVLCDQAKSRLCHFFIHRKIRHEAFTQWKSIATSSFVFIISELSHMFGQALAQWRAFSLAIARSSRLHSFSRSGHLSRCCMVWSEVPHSQAVSAAWAWPHLLKLGLLWPITRAESV